MFTFIFNHDSVLFVSIIIFPWRFSRSSIWVMHACLQSFDFLFHLKVDLFSREKFSAYSIWKWQKLWIIENYSILFQLGLFVADKYFGNLFSQVFSALIQYKSFHTRKSVPKEWGSASLISTLVEKVFLQLVYMVT